MASIPEIYSLPETFSSSLGGSWSDQEALSFLGAYRAQFEAEVRRAEVRRGDQTLMWHLMRHDSEAMEGWKTDHGTWSPKKIVSILNTSLGNSANSPKFLGMKTMMEFKPTDGSKAVVGMTRYNLLTTREDGDGLDLDDELSLCHVFPLEGKGKGTRNRNGKRSRSGYAADQFKDFDPPGLKAPEQQMAEFDFTNMDPLAMEDYHEDVQDPLFADLPSKSEPSKFWQSFTKIHTKNPKLMYAACNHCDTMLKLKGGPSCGTSSLRHHNDSCRCKPKQEQLPGNSSSMPIPFLSLEAMKEYLFS